MTRELSVGLHLYQPPREASHKNLRHIKTDPQNYQETGKNWTEVITEECYHPLAKKGLLEKVSFTCYGILREQLEKGDRQTLSVIQESISSNGVGDPFIHPLLPDLIKEDKEILTGAGINSLGFTPKYFWAPESALDNETLAILSKSGYRGVICAPEQIELESGGFCDNKPVFLELPGKINLLALPFNRRFSGALAFAEKHNSNVFAKQFILPTAYQLKEDEICIGWTDGETFGWHWKFGDIFLEYLLNNALPNHGINTIPINDLEIKNPLRGRLKERTAWSCPHGNLIRWQGVCSCGQGDLSWKAPFYKSHQKLNDAVTKIVKKEFGLKQEDYIELMASSFDKHFKNPGGVHTTPRLSLISAKVSALTSRTSCGTFFDDPHFSGNINLLFAAQTFEHLKDAGLLKQAATIEGQYKKCLAAIPDPKNPGKTVLDMLSNLLNQ
ncbi:hypothetical protein HYW46_02805 [Candidatus Daviesbacteria bacterium]|nr:hypothetical protein [Candidatus Daviesbacteria bacterium]